MGAYTNYYPRHARITIYFKYFFYFFLNDEGGPNVRTQYYSIFLFIFPPLCFFIPPLK